MQLKLTQPYRFIGASVLLCANLVSACSQSDGPTGTRANTVQVAEGTGKLTVERIVGSPALSGPQPRSIEYSPDGARLTLLQPRPDDQHRYDLWQFDVATGAHTLLFDSDRIAAVELTEAQKALRERRRIAARTGIVEYNWVSADTLLVPLNSDLFRLTLGANGVASERLTDTTAAEYDAKASPDGRYLSFVRDGALWALGPNGEERLSPAADPANAVSYAVAEFVAQEEMKRYTGYWWSADSRYVAFTRVDESGVDIVRRLDIDGNGVAVVEQRYPRAGRPNAVIDLFVRDLRTGTVHEVAWRHADWGLAADQYLAKVGWQESADAPATLWWQRVNREQTVLETLELEFGAHANVPGVVWREQQDTWINLSDDWQHWRGGRLTTTEASGYRHLTFQADAATASWQALTSGDWVVDEIVGRNDSTGTAFFTGYRDTPLERHLYRIALKGGEPVRVTTPGATWNITMSPRGDSFVGTASSPSQPPRTGLYRTNGKRIAWIEANPLTTEHPYHPYLAQHALPEFGTLTAADGQTLHYALTKPIDFDPRKRYPVIVNTYGGPGVQTVRRGWAPLSDQLYARAGYLVFRLDNRGSAHRGKRFEDVLHRRMGSVEATDQLAGVAWLRSKSFVDDKRVALMGWSYGGYLTLMTVLQAPAGTFAAAIAGAPVTDWRLYDTFYAERYMDHPDANEAGYDASAVWPHLDNLTTPLLLVHGMADDNVTFDNSTRLYGELQHKGKRFELMTYPGQRHGIQGEALSGHLLHTNLEFLTRHLGPQH